MATRKKAKGTRGGRREGAGRPPVLADPVSRWVQFEREDLEAGERLAQARRISFAEFMRRALRTYLRRQKRS